MNQAQILHEKALTCAKKYRESEGELLEVLQEIDRERVFRTLGYASLFSYAVEALKLSEAQAYNFINVARKSVTIPALKEAVTSGALSVCKARKIVPVLNSENQKEWIQKAVDLPQKEIEKQVAKEIPHVRVLEKIRPVSEVRLEFKCGISMDLEKKIKRAQDLLSQKKRMNTSLEETLEGLVDEFLRRNDPLSRMIRDRTSQKKEPYSEKNPPPLYKRTPIPSWLRRRIYIRDQMQCTFITPENKRCESKRFLDIHHIVPISKGGKHSEDNLRMLCFNHHKHQHITSITSDG